MEATSSWRAKLVEHRWIAVGGAVAAGAIAGVLLPRRVLRAKLGDALVAALTAIATRLVRDAAVARLGATALAWWDEAQARTRRRRETAS